VVAQVEQEETAHGRRELLGRRSIRAHLHGRERDPGEVLFAPDELARLDDDEVAFEEARSRDLLLSPAFADEAAGGRVGLRLPERVGLRLAAGMVEALAVVREEDGGPEPEDDLELERERAPRPDAQEGERREDGARLAREVFGSPSALDADGSGEKSGGSVEGYVLPLPARMDQ